MNPVLSSILSTGFIFAVIRVMTPLLFPALGVAVSELAGSINIALEGIMLISAFFGVIVSAFTGSLFLALIAAFSTQVGLSECTIPEGNYDTTKETELCIEKKAEEKFGRSIIVPITASQADVKLALDSESNKINPF